MPTWLVHGFRWPRISVRIHIILQNLDDCAAEWLMAPATSAQLTSNFKKMYREQMAYLPTLRFIEQYDPEDEVTKDQPWAYVCDQVHEIKLGVDVDEVRGAGVQNEAWTALVELRDKIAPGQKLGWFVVVNGDVERWAPPYVGDDDDYYDIEEEGEEEEEYVDREESQASPASQRGSVGREIAPVDDEPKPKGLKKWLGKVRSSKSSKDLKNEFAIRSGPASPPLPNKALYYPSPNAVSKA